MRKTLWIVASAAFAVALSFAADARGPGGGGFGGGMGGGFGGFGQSAPHGPSAGSSAFENSNGRLSQDRDRGLERAEDRMSQQGLEHEKATDAQKKKKQHAPDRDPGK